jgi:hypothetical protein
MKFNEQKTRKTFYKLNEIALHFPRMGATGMSASMCVTLENES